MPENRRTPVEDLPMPRSRPHRAPVAALVTAIALVLAGAVGPARAFDTGFAAATREPIVRAQPVTGPWTGEISIWRDSAFSSQADENWCVAGAVQTMLNLVDGRSSRSAWEQAQVMAYAQANDSLAVSDGSDPLGWALALRQFGSARTGTYHWEAHPSSQTALRAAAYRLRMFGRPVGLLVRGGTHANVMVGFRATADPARSGTYLVTSVQIAGPWYPRPTIDPPPGTWLSLSALSSRFTRYTETDGLDDWVGRWVIVAP